MNTFQLILIGGFGILLLLYFTLLRNRLYNRILFIIIFLIGILFVFMPNLTTQIAHKLGIGRGSDFIFYLFILLSFYAFMMLYSKQRKFSNTLTEIIRREAIKNAQFLD